MPKVATRSGAGAFLMRDHKLAEKIMRSVVQAVEIPVSIKTRLGWDDTHRDWADLIGYSLPRCMDVHGRNCILGNPNYRFWAKI